jgi:hypothetical protein
MFCSKEILLYGSECSCGVLKNGYEFPREIIAKK